MTGEAADPGGLSMIDQIRLLMQEIEESKRVIVCSAEDHAALQDAISQLPFAGLMTLKPSTVCPKGTIYVLDPNAVEAGRRQALQKVLKEPMVVSPPSTWPSRPLWTDWWQR